MWHSLVRNIALSMVVVGCMAIAPMRQFRPADVQTRVLAWYEQIEPWPNQWAEVLPGEWEEDFDPMSDYVRSGYSDPITDREMAFRALLTTNTFASITVGGGAHTSAQAYAFRRLLKEPDAKGAFEDLVARGELAGQLYGLCGLYLLDRATFDRHVGRYREIKKKVNTFAGCLSGSERVCDLVDDDCRAPSDHRRGSWDIAGGLVPNTFKRWASQ